jgi:four helix bundle protein
MGETPSPKQNVYDLEERTLLFTKRVARYVNKLPKTIPNVESGKQLMRAGGSIGANYIEANECLGRKDFAMKIKTSKKEAKETRYWLAITEPTPEEEKEKAALSQEATELMKIFGSILEKTK